MSLDVGTRGERRGPTMRPASRAQTRIALALVAVAVGFLAGIQAAQRDTETARLAAEAPEDLTRILADLNAEADALASQVADLRVKLFRYQDTTARDDLALQDARKAVADLRVLAGTSPVRGPGVELTISDPRGLVTWEPILDLVQELRDAGAEAIALNDRRVVASTWFGPATPGIIVDGERILPPFRILAIGSPEAMGEALNIPGGPLTLMQAQPSVSAVVEEERRLLLPALQRELTFRYARPAP